MATTSKKDFRDKIEGRLSERGLQVEDLQVNLRLEDVDDFMGFIGKDWYSFGICMGVGHTTMNHLKKIGVNKPGRKKKLLEHLIKVNKVRYEDIVYGLYNSQDKQDPSINDILDHLLTRRRHYELSSPRSLPKRRKFIQYRGQSTEVHIWQSVFAERCKKPPRSILRPLSELSPESYCDHFYSMLWYEEKEHMKKLRDKCDGKYNLFLYDRQNVPVSLNPDHNSCYGFIEGPDLTDDKIEYATQASDSVTLIGKDGSPLCKAFKHQYNFSHLESQMYLKFQRHNFPWAKIIKCPKVKESCYEVKVNFEVKHSYFDHLQYAVVKVPDYIKMCLLPSEMSFKPLFCVVEPMYLDFFDFMKLDTDKQSEALQMITSHVLQMTPSCPPPPVILYGPFGSGKTRILARAAYEVMMNGINTKKRTRILICAHHPHSIDIFIYAYFGRLEKAQKLRLPFKIIEISRFDKDAGAPYCHMYMTLNQLSQQKLRICGMNHLIVIATYTMSLNLQDIFKEGFFTHLFLDEAAQVREPEAITPLSMATLDAKIVLAGDDKQVGPNILVLGEEARKYDLHISLLERMMKRYTKLGPIAESYVTKLIVNYRSHKSLVELPNLFYRDDHLQLSDDKRPWEHKGPKGYSFVCSDSRVVPSYVSEAHPLVEACVVLEEVLIYIKRLKESGIKLRHPRNICIISSTRKQLNQIRTMAYKYEAYAELRGVSFLPSFTIQGHEFDAVFLGLFEPIENDEKGAFYIKSLFNPYVFNTVLTRARTRVVAIGKPKEVIEFENASFDSQPYKFGFKCWHEYLKLCIKQDTLHHCEFIEELEELMESNTTSQPNVLPSRTPITVPTTVQQFHHQSGTLQRTKSLPKPTVSPISVLHSPTSSNAHSFNWQSSQVVQKQPHQTSFEKEMPRRQLTDPVNPQRDYLLTQAEQGRKKAIFQSYRRPWPLETIEPVDTTNKEEVLDVQPHYSKDITRQDIIQISSRKDPLREMIAKTVEEKDNVFDELVQLKKGFQDLKKNLENEMNQKIDTNLRDLCYDLTRENDKLRKSLKQVAQRTIIDPSSSTVVATLEVAIRTNDEHYVNWKEYGMKISIPQNVCPNDKECIVTVEALAGGEFAFPAGMDLVSAVYSINVSQALIKPITLDLEHCVHLTNKAELKYLKFAIASHHSGPPYQFKFVEGGKFTVGSRYGVINRSIFSLICIGLEGESGDTSSSSDEEDDEQMGQQDNNIHEEEEEEEEGGGGGEGGSSAEGGTGPGSDKKSGDGESDGSSNNLSQPNEGSKEVLPIDSGAMVLPGKETNSIQSPPVPPKPSIKRKKMHTRISYNGQMFYRNHQEIVVFAAVKQLEVLLKYLNNNEKDIEGQSIDFSFANQDAYIELIFKDENQKQSTEGWNVQPQSDPCKLTKYVIDKFGSFGKPAKCFINVHPVTTKGPTVSTLNYCVVLKGIHSTCKNIFICLKRNEKVLSADALSEATVTTTTVQSKPLLPPSEIFQKHFKAVQSLLKNADLLLDVAASLYSAGLISETSYDSATDDSSCTDSKKATRLSKAIKDKINNEPESLRKLIVEFDQFDEFRTIAKLMNDELR